MGQNRGFREFVEEMGGTGRFLIIKSYGELDL